MTALHSHPAFRSPELPAVADDERALAAEVEREEQLLAELKARREAALATTVEAATATERDELKRLEHERHQLLDKLEGATDDHRHAKLRAHVRGFAIALFWAVFIVMRMRLG